MAPTDPAQPAEEFDPHDPAITADDLYQRYGRLRAAYPVSRHGPHGGCWMATGFDELIDGFTERGEADLIRDFAEPLPLTLVGELSG
jgi:hypothetical protein